LNLDFDKDVNGEWEYVMVSAKTDDDEEGEDNEASSIDENNMMEEEDNLDMPPPWCPKLFVHPEKFEDRTKGGGKTLYYKRCKVDFYPQCKQVDGLIKRIYLYADYKRLINTEIRSYYSCRKDNLVLRRRFPY
jgi:hypothetical protein